MKTHSSVWGLRGQSPSMYGQAFRRAGLSRRGPGADCAGQVLTRDVRIAALQGDAYRLDGMTGAGILHAKPCLSPGQHKGEIEQGAKTCR
jgi:hypothetical protein